jgi:hypothetical protein
METSTAAAQKEGVMKIKQVHYKTMENKITEYLLENKTSLAKLLNQYIKNGLSLMQFRWDISYAAIGSKWICDNLYPYLNDTHIDTALRRLTDTK